MIAVARDEAFCFYYPENLELLAAAGASVEFFSPLRGERPSSGAAGVYLGGGYPELHGAALAANGGAMARVAGPARTGCTDLRRMWRLHGVDPGVDRQRRMPLADGRVSFRGMHA